MDPVRARQLVDERCELGQKLRLEGNEHFKAGDTKKALQCYHLVIAQLRGLEQAVCVAYPPSPREPDEAPIGEPAKLDENGEPSKHWNLKNILVLTYCNMAACHTKTANWKRSLECAQAALKIDPDTKKATYREAQARIGLGEVEAGKKLLLELQKQGNDSAVTGLLKQLEIEEKERLRKANKSMFGFLKEKSSDPAGSVKDSTSDKNES